MIQRIQTIFLFLAGIALVLSLFFPIWQKVDQEKKEVATLHATTLILANYDATGEQEVTAEKYVFYIGLIAVLAAAVCFYSIARYRNRLLQIKLGALISFLILGLVVSILLTVSKAEALMGATSAGNYLFGFYLPFVALVFNFMANRFIRKDEMLVRSADRIR